MKKGAVVGLGNLGLQYANLIESHHETELTAVCDSDKIKLEAYQCKHKDVAVFSDYRELMQSDVDFVYVGTPDFAHAGPAIAAASAGKHLLLEKPLAMSVEEASSLAQIISDNGVMAKICFTNRWNQPFAVAKQSIEQGRIGQVLHIHARLNDRITVPTKMISWASKTSPGWFLMSHILDLALWIADDEVQKVHGAGQKQILSSVYGIDTFDSIHAFLYFKNGVLAHLESSWILPETFPFIVDFKLQVVGSKGCIHVDTHDQMVHCSAVNHEHLPSLDASINGRMTGQVSLSYDDFVDCLCGRSTVSATVQDGVENTELLALIHRAAEAGGDTLDVDR